MLGGIIGGIRLTCIASGHYSYITFSLAGNPLLMTSVDGGVTWTTTVSGAAPSLPSDYSSNGIFVGSNLSSQGQVDA